METHIPQKINTNYASNKAGVKYGFDAKVRQLNLAIPPDFVDCIDN